MTMNAKIGANWKAIESAHVRVAGEWNGITTAWVRESGVWKKFHGAIATIPGIDEYTVLMLHGSGADGSAVFTDSSNSAHAITANGNAQIDTGYSKLGDSSALFDGGDYLRIADHNDFDFGTGDFTIDAWIRLTSMSGTAIYSHGNGNNSTDFFFWVNSSGKLTFTNSDNSNYCSNTLSTHIWYHVAMVRSGSTLKMYVDGVQYYSATHSNNLTSSDTVGIGVRTQGSGLGPTPYFFRGHIDELRVSKGIARWTENFTPPDLPYG